MPGSLLALYRRVCNDSFLLLDATILYTRHSTSNTTTSVTLRTHAERVVDGVQAYIADGGVADGSDAPHSSLAADLLALTVRGFCVPLIEVLSQFPLFVLRTAVMTADSLTSPAIVAALMSAVRAAPFAVLPFCSASLLTEWRDNATTVIALTLPLLERMHRSPSLDIRRARGISKQERADTHSERGVDSGLLMRAANVALAHPLWLLSYRTLASPVARHASDALDVTSALTLAPHLAMEQWRTQGTAPLVTGLRPVLLTALLPISSALRFLVTDFLTAKHAFPHSSFRSALYRYCAFAGIQFAGGLASYAACRLLVEALLLLLDARGAASTESRHRFLLAYWKKKRKR